MRTETATKHHSHRASGTAGARRGRRAVVISPERPAAHAVGSPAGRQVQRHTILSLHGLYRVRQLVACFGTPQRLARRRRNDLPYLCVVVLVRRSHF
jgi:hypothetical protein